MGVLSGGPEGRGSPCEIRIYVTLEGETTFVRTLLGELCSATS